MNLFRAAPYRHMLVLPKDALFHYSQKKSILTFGRNVLLKFDFARQPLSKILDQPKNLVRDQHSSLFVPKKKKLFQH